MANYKSLIFSEKQNRREKSVEVRSDQIKKGAALNAVQIAEYLIKAKGLK